MLHLGLQYVSIKHKLEYNNTQQEFKIYGGVNPLILKNINAICEDVRLKPNNIIIDGKCIIINLQSTWLKKVSQKIYRGKFIINKYNKK